MLELVAQNNHLQISFSDTNKDRPSSGIALKIKDLEKNTKLILDINYLTCKDICIPGSASLELIIPYLSPFNKLLEPTAFLNGP